MLCDEKSKVKDGFSESLGFLSKSVMPTYPAGPGIQTNFPFTFRPCLVYKQLICPILFSGEKAHTEVHGTVLYCTVLVYSN